MSQVSVQPAACLGGGEVLLEAEAFPVEEYARLSVWFGDARARITMLTRRRMKVHVPDDARDGHLQIRRDDTVLFETPVQVGEVVLRNIHAVDNPVVDRLGYVYTTFSGTRDEVPEVSVYRIAPDGTVDPYITAIRNATSLALNAQDQLFVSSRFESRVYRVLDKDQLEVFAEDLGVPFGLAFNDQGVLFVGDRGGRVLKIMPDGEKTVFIELPPSPISYHLAFDPDGNLFVSVPQFGTDTIYMVDPFGHVIPYYTGFGRPHGMAFDRDGNLYVSQGRVGDGGVYRITSEGQVEKILAGPPVVGIAFDAEGRVWINTAHALHRLHLGIYPRERGPTPGPGTA